MNGTAEIVAALKRGPCTYRDMLLVPGYIGSVSPWKRAAEWLETAEGSKYKLVKGKRWLGGKRYLVTWRIVRA